MKINKMYAENFRTFEQRNILNGIKSDKLPVKKNIPAWDCTSSKSHLCPLIEQPKLGLQPVERLIRLEWGKGRVPGELP